MDSYDELADKLTTPAPKRRRRIWRIRFDRHLDHHDEPSGGTEFSLACSADEQAIADRLTTWTPHNQRRRP